MPRKLGSVIVTLVALLAVPLVAHAAPITDLGVIYDATYALVGTGVGTQTYQITVTAQTSGSTLPGDFLTSLAIKIAASVNSFSLVSGPAGSAVRAGGVDSGGCNGSGSGFVCDGFTPILMPAGLVKVVLNEIIPTGTLVTGNLAASLEAEYCQVGTGIGTTGLGCPQSQNWGITSRELTLSPTPVPEPVTMFLGGTGLLILGYVARKRLFAVGGRLAA